MSPLPLPCSSDADQRNALPPPDSEVVGVYFACNSEPPGDEYPVYLQLRDVPPGQSELEERLSFALAEYLKGPTNEESQRGYEGVTGTPVTGVLDSVSIDENGAEVSFKSSFESKVSSASTTALLLLSQVGATVFQFQDLNELELQISGDCDRFWRLREGACTTVTREEWGL